MSSAPSAAATVTPGPATTSVPAPSPATSVAVGPAVGSIAPPPPPSSIALNQATAVTAPQPNHSDGSVSAQTTVDGPSVPVPSPTTPVSELANIRAHIQSLTQLNNRLQAIRHIPAQLLRPPGKNPHIENATLLTHGFRELTAIGDLVRSKEVQVALKVAQKSERSDSTNLRSNLRRENLKRRRPPSPESPQPYRETESKDTTLLPPVEPGTIPVSLLWLPAYIRDYNKCSNNRLHIVSPKKGRNLECPITLRFISPNVTTVYLVLDCSPQGDQALVVESATAIGSREQKPAHSQSEFAAFQNLSQQLAKVIRSDPLAPLQSYVELLGSYERLFVDPCSNCQRVISAEAHVPPVVRRRLPRSADPKAPLWDVRHVLCKYEPPPPPQPSADNTGAEAGGEASGEVGGNGGA